MKGQNFGQAEEAFKVTELVHQWRLPSISGFQHLPSPLEYAFMCARQASRPLYYVVTSPLCGKVFLKDQNFVDENEEAFEIFLNVLFSGMKFQK
jgi:hypothetical protein